ncbi:MAG: YggS family pyridoxal phosphate-dependent enzyme [Tannerella sp.]|jgi:pyridoxal phosphate enzyme (YggS family)|nr:YggS family pyridoxal phosphate-dependent enzyme [Tannerella sp.]
MDLSKNGRTAGSIASRIAYLKGVLPAGIRLVAVSKFHPAEAIREAYEAGQRAFGENRAQEMAAKHRCLPEDIEWHFIGTLQTNKIKDIIPFVYMIQSVDSLKLAAEIERQAAKIGRTINVLFEVHIASEDSKHGLLPAACEKIFRETDWQNYPHLRLCGLMGMATFTEDEEQVKEEFRRLHELFGRIKKGGNAPSSFCELSMGMTDDYRLAVQEGSTMVRIGSFIFGQRPPQA